MNNIHLINDEEIRKRQVEMARILTSRWVSQKEILVLVPFSESTLKRLIAKGKFPAPKKMTDGDRPAIAWNMEEFFEWEQGMKESNE